MKDCQDCPEPVFTMEGLRVEPSHPLIWTAVGAGVSMISTTVPPTYDRIDVAKNGDITYKKGADDFEPPAPIDGYSRCTENPWSFKLIWEPCRHRLYSLAVKANCQCVDMVAVCMLGGFDEGHPQYVCHDDCQGCEIREDGLRTPVKGRVVSDLLLPPHLPVRDPSHNTKAGKPGTI